MRHYLTKAQHQMTSCAQTCNLKFRCYKTFATTLVVTVLVSPDFCSDVYSVPVQSNKLTPHFTWLVLEPLHTFT